MNAEKILLFLHKGQIMFWNKRIKGWFMTLAFLTLSLSCVWIAILFFVHRSLTSGFAFVALALVGLSITCRIYNGIGATRKVIATAGFNDYWELLEILEKKGILTLNQSEKKGFVVVEITPREELYLERFGYSARDQGQIDRENDLTDRISPVG